MPPDIKLSRVPHNVMIDAVMRRRVHTHYKGTARFYELCRRSQEFACDVCTAGSPKEFWSCKKDVCYCSKPIRDLFTGF